jgi:hypothetical protein
LGEDLPNFFAKVAALKAPAAGTFPFAKRQANKLVGLDWLVVRLPFAKRKLKKTVFFKFFELLQITYVLRYPSAITAHL